MTKLLVQVYSEKNCGLCSDAKTIIGKVNKEIPFQYDEVEISSSDDLNRRYKSNVPTIFINGKKAFKFKVDEDEFRKQVRKELIKEGLSRVWNKKG